MKTLNPFIPTVPLISVPSRSRRERFKKVVFTVLAAHVALLLCLLMTDYHHDLVIYARELPNGATPPTIDPPEAAAETAAHVPVAAAVTAVAKPAPVAAKVAAAPAAAHAETFYTVQSGDTLDSIARKYGTTAKAIRTANNLPTEHLRVSQKLKVL